MSPRFQAAVLGTITGLSIAWWVVYAMLWPSVRCMQAGGIPVQSITGPWCAQPLIKKE